MTYIAYSLTGLRQLLEISTAGREEEYRAAIQAAKTEYPDLATVWAVNPRTCSSYLIYDARPLEDSK